MTNITKPHHEYWDEIWSKDDVPDWDYLSQVILNVLKNEIGDVKDKRILEAGSGSGRISLGLAKGNAAVSLLDNSMNAINFSKDLFEKSGERPNIVCAPIHAMPYGDDTFDVVWNAGVIEHFTGKEQEEVLSEMVRVCKKGGLVVTINPYAKSILHTFGRFVMEKMGRYPFGDEVPVTTLKDKSDILGCGLKKEEYSIGFVVLWVGMFKRLTLLPMGKVFKFPLSILNKTFCCIDSSPFGKILRKLDLFTSKLFGGYLLVSIFKKRQGDLTGGV